MIPDVLKKPLVRSRIFHELREIYIDHSFRSWRPDYPEDFRKTGSTFIHVPKCAGNSFTMSLYGKPSIEVGGHATAEKFRRADPKAFASSFSFAVTRHPVDRFVSAFYFLRAGGIHGQEQDWANVFIPKDLGIDEFVNRLSFWRYRSIVLRKLMFKPQVKFVCSPDGKLLVNFLARYENIDEDYRYIVSQIDTVHKALARENITPNRPSVEVTRKVLQFVQQYYQKDFEALNYSR